MSWMLRFRLRHHFPFTWLFAHYAGCYFSVSCAVTSDLPYISVWMSFRAESSDMFSVHTHYPVTSFNLLVLNIIWTLTSPRFMSLPGFSSDFQTHIFNCLFKKYFKCSIYNTKLLSLPPDMLNQVRPRSVMASPSFTLHTSFGIISNAFLSLILCIQSMGNSFWLCLPKISRFWTFSTISNALYLAHATVILNLGYYKSYIVIA